MQNPQYDFANAPENETGRKTYFWYRVYLAALAVVYLAVAVLATGVIIVQPQGKTAGETAEIFLSSAVFAVLGWILFAAFAAAFFLPRKPYNWIVGLVLIALGMTSACCLPAAVPLLIFWLKPETKAHFGRA